MGHILETFIDEPGFDRTTNQTSESDSNNIDRQNIIVLNSEHINRDSLMFDLGETSGSCCNDCDKSHACSCQNQENFKLKKLINDFNELYSQIEYINLQLAKTLLKNYSKDESELLDYITKDVLINNLGSIEKTIQTIKAGIGMK